jgi:hypothetical protein
MKYWIKYLHLVIILNLISAIGYSQEVEQKPDVISFYLDCWACDFTFVRQELPFVSFVRNPQLADVHIMVTDAQTGGGGHKYFLNFIGKNEYSDFNNAYEVVSHQSDTEDDRRRVLLRYLKIGILQYYAKTGFSDNLNIDIRENENRKADDMVIDRWNNWVFNFETGGELDKEQKQNEYSLVTEVRAEKITEDWKTEIEASYEVNRENYYNGGNIITNKQVSKDLWVTYVKSLTDKWSTGFLGTYSSSTFLNTENTYGTGAGIEYNFFPWKECNRRVFSIQYMVGIQAFNYFDETIYNKTEETFFGEDLKMRLELIQQWGEISLELYGKHYFNDFSKNRLTIDFNTSVRFTKNFSVFCNIHSSAIHDQLYLAKKDFSIEDILLERRKQATTYELHGKLGLRFTFGSIYNNIVNERFN